MKGLVHRIPGILAIAVFVMLLTSAVRVLHGADDESQFGDVRKEISNRNYDGALDDISVIEAELEYLKGEALMGADKQDEAATHFLKALELYPDYYEANEALGELYYEKGRYEKAKSYFLKAYEINNESVYALNYLGYTMRDMGDLEGALTYLEKAAKLDETVAESHLNLGTVLVMLKEYKRASDELEKALAMDPLMYVAYNNLSYAYYMMGKYEQALAALEKSLQINPRDQKVLENMAFLEEKIQDIRETHENAAKAEQMDEGGGDDTGPLAGYPKEISLKDVIERKEAEQAMSRASIYDLQYGAGNQYGLSDLSNIGSEPETGTLAMNETPEEEPEDTDSGQYIFENEAPPDTLADEDESFSIEVVEGAGEELPDIQEPEEEEPSPAESETLMMSETAETEEVEAEMKAPVEVASAMEDEEPEEMIAAISDKPAEMPAHEAAPKKDAGDMAIQISKASSEKPKAAETKVKLTEPAPKTADSVSSEKNELIASAAPAPEQPADAEAKAAKPASMSMLPMPTPLLNRNDQLAIDPIDEALTPLPLPSSGITSPLGTLAGEFLNDSKFSVFEISEMVKSVPGVIYFEDRDREMWRYQPGISAFQKMFKGLNPECSKDGNKLAYVDWDKRKISLYVYEFETSTRTRILDSDGLVKNPEFSPEGKYISYVIIGPGFSEILRLIDLDNQEIIKPPKDVQFSSYSWNPATNEIFMLLEQCEDSNAGENTACFNVWNPSNGELKYKSIDLHKIGGENVLVQYMREPVIEFPPTDDKLLLYDRGLGSEEYYVVNLETGVSESGVFKRPDGNNIPLRDLTWGPDSRSLAQPYRGKVWVKRDAGEQPFPLLMGFFINSGVSWCKVGTNVIEPE